MGAIAPHLVGAEQECEPHVTKMFSREAGNLDFYVKCSDLQMSPSN